MLWHYWALLMTDSGFKSGYVAIIGRPNVGKSTLINRILAQKLCITSRRPQTTRHRILGIKNTDNSQLIYVDTPGINTNDKRAINRYMNRAAVLSIDNVDVILFMIDGIKWTGDDQRVLGRLAQHADAPVILVINKIDTLADKNVLLPQINRLASAFNFASIVPVSARKGFHIDRLEINIINLMPLGVPIFPYDQFTDRSTRFLAAELVREKLFRYLGQELPYSLTVDIEQFADEQTIYRIDAAIYVERNSQKAIVIGKKGQLLKTIGREARLDMQRLFARKVFLCLWVRVYASWRDDERMLKSMGYDNQ